MKYKEIEFKYGADEIKLTKFNEFCKSRNPSKFKVASGYDHFYDKVSDSGSFCRHRIGPDCNQLTFKRKTEDKNNYIRTEHNVDMTKKMSEPQIKELCSEFGYEYSFSLFKNCFIYGYEYYSLVYYICYNIDMKEVGRYVEIEMAEDYTWRNEDHAWAELTALERLCKTLGISPQARIKKSLYELHKD